MKPFSISGWCRSCNTTSNPAFENDLQSVAKAVQPQQTPHQSGSVHQPPAGRIPAWFMSHLSRKPKASAPGLHGLGQWNKEALHKALNINNTTTAGVLFGTLTRARILDSIGTNLRNDINTVLELYEPGKQETDEQKARADAADKAFQNAYKSLFKPNSFTTFQNSSFRELMRALAAQLPSSSTQVSAEPPVAYPGFKPAATSQAFERIRATFLQEFVPAAAPADRAGGSSADVDPASIPLPASPKMETETTMASAAEAKAPLSPAERRRADERIDAEVNAMQLGNDQFRHWLANNELEAAFNRGKGLNCLIISLLQHATGAYGREYETALSAEAEKYRDELGIGQGMLFSDDDAASRIVAAINTDFGVNMTLVEVQSDELGRPFFSTPWEHLPEKGNKVVVWQHGNHFEALYAKDTVPASRPQE